jgi:hypothetical protein
VHYPSEHLALLLVGSSAPDIASNPNLICRRRPVAEVAIARREVVEDYQDQIACRTRLLMMYRGDTVYDFRFLGWRQPSNRGTANVGRHPNLLQFNATRALET